MECRLHHRLSKFDWSVFLISYFLAFIIWLGFLSRIYWSSLDHDLMAGIWQKAISIQVVVILLQLYMLQVLTGYWVPAIFSLFVFCIRKYLVTTFDLLTTRRWYSLIAQTWKCNSYWNLLHIKRMTLRLQYRSHHLRHDGELG